MIPPARLIDASNGESERLLLRAGRAPAPAGARERALLAATAAMGASSLAVGGAAAGHAALGSKAGAMVALGSLKWIVVTGAVGVGIAAGVVVVDRVVSPRQGAGVATSDARVRRVPELRAATPSTPHAPVAPVAPFAASASGLAGSVRATASAPPSARAPAPVAPASAGAPAPVAPAFAGAPAIVSAPASVAPASTAASPITLAPTPTGSAALSFSDELTTLDGARAAVDVGEPAHALSILEAYRVRFPNGAMRPEAAILRIEALEKAGDHRAALRAADAFFAADPASPYAERVRSLVGMANP